MALDASDPKSQEDDVVTQLAVEEVARRFAGAGWIDFELMASRLGWKKSRLSFVLRRMKKTSQLHVVETRLSGDEARVRVTSVASDEKQMRQLSSDIVRPLARLYVQLKHGDRSRQKLANDVKTIAARIAPFLAEQEFQHEYRKLSAKLSRTPEGDQVDKREESHIAPTEQAFTSKPKRSTQGNAGAITRFYDSRRLPRLCITAVTLVVAAIATVLFITTLLQAMNLVSRYVERVAGQSELY